MSEKITLKIYENYDLVSAKSFLARDASEAADLSKKIGFPVALKIESPDILHKTDTGGVKLDLYSENEARKAFDDIMLSVKESRPDASIKGITVQEMFRDCFEIIIGYKFDKDFGPTIMFGMGGIFAEVFGDVVFRTLPVSKEDVSSMIDELKFSDILLNGYRSVKSVSKEMLSDVILKAGRMAYELFEDLDSFDMNPVVLKGDEHRIVDFKYVKSSQKNYLTDEKPYTKYLERFFDARSVAVIGASGSSRDKLGNYILDSLIFYDYKGRVYPVNPKSKMIMGVKAYPSLSDIPDRVDLVVVSIPLSGVPEILEQCREKDIHNIVIISGGGKEAGSVKLERSIKDAAHKYDIRIIGCNCIGVFDAYSRLDTFFQLNDVMSRPRAGSVSMMTQSGTVGAGFIELMDHAGMSKFVSYGNRIDVDEADLLKFYEDDPRTKVIAVYVEGFDKGRKFFNTAKKVSRKKPVVIFKSGRSSKSSDLSISHTGFLSGTYNLSRGIFNQAGLMSVDSFEELVAASKALAMQKRADGNRVLAVTDGAGTVIQAVDRMEKKKILKMAELTEESKRYLEEKLPAYAIIKNPIDLTGSGTDKDYEISIRTAMEDPGIDIIMLWFLFQDTPVSRNISRNLSICCRNPKKPIVIGATGGEYTRYMSGLIEKAAGIPVYSSVNDWVTAAEALAIK